MATLVEILGDPHAIWSRQPPVSEAVIQELSASCGFTLPAEYVSFLRFSNGGEGSLCIEPWCFQLYPAEEIIPFNRGYKVDEFLPAYFAIGSNGAGEMFVIRKREGSPCPVYMVPMVPMAESDVVQIAHDFEMFAMAFGRDGTEM